MTETTTSDEFAHFFQVRLDSFDGPIDLLLHLVKQRELEIEKISLAAVTEQYLQCIEQVRRFDLEIAGEYMVIAATLLSIKASILLNEPVELIEDEDGNLVNPHEELLKKLREAQVYKEGASMLGRRSQLGIDVFAPPSILSEFAPPPVEYRNHDPILLGQAFKALLERVPQNAGLTITIDSISIVDNMMSIINKLKAAQGPVVFYKLIPDINSRSSIIGSFVALLELCKRQAIRVRQSETFKDIEIVMATADFETSGLSSEFDAVEVKEEDLAVNR